MFDTILLALSDAVSKEEMQGFQQNTKKPKEL